MYAVMTVLSGTIGSSEYRGVVLDVAVRGLERKRRRLEGLIDEPNKERADPIAVLALVSAPLFPFGIVLARHAMRTVRRNARRGSGMARAALIIGWTLPALIVLASFIVSFGQWHLDWCTGDEGRVCFVPGP
jgi:drug/metabolite transporter (DMT)-like permease